MKKIALLSFIVLSLSISKKMVAQCSISFNYNASNDPSIVFNVTGSTDVVGGNPVLTWDMGNGNTFTTNGIDTSLNYQYTQNGLYYVCVTLYDSAASGLCFQTFCDSVPVNNYQYNCVSSFQPIDSADGTFIFMNNSSPGAYYLWEFGDGSPSSTDYHATHTYTYNGFYTVKLLVFDSLNNCSITSYQTIQVINALNSCGVATLYAQDNGNGNFSFDSHYTLTNPHYISWNFGDGSVAHNQLNAFHLYQADGYYVVTMSLNDSLTGCRIVKNTTINVSGSANSIVCNANFVATVDSNLVITLYNNSVGQNLAYNWSFGDGSASTLAYPTHNYAGTGPYEVCLTVDNNSGCVHTFCDSIYAGGEFNKSNGFTVQVLSPLGTTININSKSFEFDNVQLYPNPAKDQVIIKFNLEDNQEFQITLFDVTGKRVKEVTNLKNSIVNINLNDVYSGMYFLNIKNSTYNETVKLLVK